jgi:hypothetical protein
VLKHTSVEAGGGAPRGERLTLAVPRPPPTRPPPGLGVRGGGGAEGGEPATNAVRASRPGPRARRAARPGGRASMDLYRRSARAHELSRRAQRTASTLIPRAPSEVGELWTPRRRSDEVVSSA